MAASSSELQKAVDKLIKREAGWKAFDKKPQVGPRPGTKTVGRPSGTQQTSALVLEEADYTTREYWAPRIVQSTDGILVWYEEPIKKIVLVGDQSFLFAEPVTPP